MRYSCQTAGSVLQASRHATVAIFVVLFVVRPVDAEDGLSQIDLLVPVGATFEADFVASNGSFLGVYSVERREVLCIRIEGPTVPEEDCPPRVRYSRSPSDPDSFRLMQPDDVRSFVGMRLKKAESISKVEASFVSVVHVHGTDVARIKNWGFGVAHIIKGDWPQVFVKPKPGLVFPEE